MTKPSTIMWIGLLAGIVPFVATARAADSPFEKSFAPIVLRNCVGCHNPSEAKGGLDLTSKQTTLKGGKTGEVIVAGKPDESLLIERVTDGSMPPKGKGARLSKEDVALLAAWVKTGAEND